MRRIQRLAGSVATLLLFVLASTLFAGEGGDPEKQGPSLEERIEAHCRKREWKSAAELYETLHKTKKSRAYNFLTKKLAGGETGYLNLVVELGEFPKTAYTPWRIIWKLREEDLAKATKILEWREEIPARQLLGWTLIKRKMGKEGMSILEDVLAKSPASEKRLFDYALAVGAVGATEEATKLYLRILESQKGKEDVKENRKLRVKLVELMGRKAGVVPFLEEAISDPSPLVSRTAAERWGRFAGTEDADRLLRSSLAGKPEALLAAGGVWARLNDHARAAECFRKVLGDKEASEAVHRVAGSGLFRALAALEDWAQFEREVLRIPEKERRKFAGNAHRLLDDASKKGSEGASLLYVKLYYESQAETDWSRKRFTGFLMRKSAGPAIEFLDVRYRLHKDLAAGWALGKLAESEKKVDLAKEIFRGIFDKSDIKSADHPSAAVELGSMAIREDRHDEGVLWYRTLAEYGHVKRNHWEWPLREAIDGRMNLAKAAVKAWRKSSPSSLLAMLAAETREEIASLFEESFLGAEAEIPPEMLERARALESWRVWRLLGELFKRAGKWESVVTFCREASKIDPYRIEPHFLRIEAELMHPDGPADLEGGWIRILQLSRNRSVQLKKRLESLPESIGNKVLPLYWHLIERRDRFGADRRALAAEGISKWGGPPDKSRLGHLWARTGDWAYAYALARYALKREDHDATATWLKRAANGKPESHKAAEWILRIALDLNDEGLAQGAWFTMQEIPNFDRVAGEIAPLFVKQDGGKPDDLLAFLRTVDDGSLVRNVLHEWTFAMQGKGFPIETGPGKKYTDPVELGLRLKEKGETGLSEFIAELLSLAQPHCASLLAEERRKKFLGLKESGWNVTPLEPNAGLKRYMERNGVLTRSVLWQSPDSKRILRVKGWKTVLEILDRGEAWDPDLLKELQEIAEKERKEFFKALEAGEFFMGSLLAGRILTKGKDQDDAYKHFEAAFKLRPRSADAIMAFFEALLAVNEPEKAAKLYKVFISKPGIEAWDLRRRMMHKCEDYPMTSGGKVYAYIHWADRDIRTQAIAEVRYRWVGGAPDKLEELEVPLAGKDAGPFLAACVALSRAGQRINLTPYLPRIVEWYKADPGPGAAWTLCRALLADGKYREALPHLHESANALLEVMEDSDELKAFLARTKRIGEAHFALGKSEKAMEWLLLPLRDERTAARLGPRWRLDHALDVAWFASEHGMRDRFEKTLQEEILRPDIDADDLVKNAVKAGELGFLQVALSAARRLKSSILPLKGIAKGLLEITESIGKAERAGPEALQCLRWVEMFPLDEGQRLKLLHLRWRLLVLTDGEGAVEAAEELGDFLQDRSTIGSWADYVLSLAHWHARRGDAKAAARALRILVVPGQLEGVALYEKWLMWVKSLDLGEEVFEVLREAEKSLPKADHLRIFRSGFNWSPVARKYCLERILGLLDDPEVPKEKKRQCEIILTQFHMDSWAPSMGEWLPILLEHKNPRMRQWACELVRFDDVHPPVMGKVLRLAIADANGKVREAARAAASMAGCPIAAVALERELQAGSEKAKAFLEREKLSRTGRLFKELSDKKTIGDPGRSLLEIMSKGTEDQRVESIARCTDWPGTATQACLLYHLLYRSVRVRRLSALALFLREGFDSANTLHPGPPYRIWSSSHADRHILFLASRDSDPFCRALVLRTLSAGREFNRWGSWGGKGGRYEEHLNPSMDFCERRGGLPEVYPMFEGTDARAAAARLLESDDSWAVKRLEALMESEEPRIRAVALLRRIEEGIPGAARDALKALQGEDGWVAASAGYGFQWIKKMKMRKTARVIRIGKVPPAMVLHQAFAGAVKKHPRFASHLVDCAGACGADPDGRLRRSITGTGEVGKAPGHPGDWRAQLATGPVEILLAALFLFREGNAGDARKLVARLMEDPKKHGYLRMEGLKAFDEMLACFEGMVGLPRPIKKYIGFVETMTAPKVLFVDRQEVSRREYRAYLKANSLPSLLQPESMWSEKALDLPMVFVSRAEAASFAEAVGKRLPTPKEWQDAALQDRFFQRRKHPWGDESDPKGANIGGTEKLPWPVSRGGKDISPCGAVNFFGNVREWCAGPKMGVPPDETAPVLGFSWLEGQEKLVFPGRFPEPVDLRSPTIGFRCVKDFPKNSEILKVFKLILG